MNKQSSGFLKNYSGILKLLIGIIAGTVLGLSLGKQVEVLKPLGDIFLNLLLPQLFHLFSLQYLLL